MIDKVTITCFSFLMRLGFTYTWRKIHKTTDTGSSHNQHKHT